MMKRERKPIKRIFIVGCGRSGTTLLQGILSAHPGITSFPETMVFTQSMYGFRWAQYGPVFGLHHLPVVWAGKFLMALGFASPMVRKRLPRFFEIIGKPEEMKRFERLPLRLRSVLRAFIEYLDDNAGEVGWIEKTPNNVFCLDLIEKYVPDPKIIHIVRDGKATVASIADAAERYNNWGQKFPQERMKRLQWITALRNRSVARTYKYIDRPNHLLVRYEDLTNSPENEIRRITDFLGVEYSDAMKEFDASSYIADHEEWKKNMGHSIEKKESKFTTLFSDEEQRFVEKRLKHFS